MTREAFIRKWLANPEVKYDEQFRDEMRDDLDKVINYALRITTRGKQKQPAKVDESKLK